MSPALLQSQTKIDGLPIHVCRSYTDNGMYWVQLCLKKKKEKNSIQSINLMRSHLGCDIQLPSLHSRQQIPVINPVNIGGMYNVASAKQTKTTLLKDIGQLMYSTYFVEDPNLAISSCSWNSMPIIMKENSLLLQCEQTQK